MNDLRLRKGQVKMVLKRQHALSSHGVFEMLRSKQVYQVQSELAKELDHTVKTLRNQAQLESAAYRAKKAAFLKRIQRREKKTRILTELLSTLPTLEELKSKDVPNISNQWVAPQSIPLNQEPVFVLNVSPPEDNHVIRHQLSARERYGRQESTKERYGRQESTQTTGGEDDEGNWAIPSPNTQWMNDIRRKDREKRKLLSSARRKRSSRGRVTNVLVKKTAPQGKRNAMIIVTADSGDEKTSPQGKTNATLSIRADSDLIKVTEERSEEMAERQSDQMRGRRKECLYFPHCGNKETAMNLQASQTPSVLHIAEQSETDERYNGGVHKAGENFSGKAKFDPQLMFSASQRNSFLDSKHTNKEDLNAVLEKSEKTHVRLRYPLRNYLKRGRASTKSVTDRPGLPGFRVHVDKRGRSYPGAEPGKSRAPRGVQRPRSLEREATVSMIYIEDKKLVKDPQALGISQFDIEALLAYRRLKRGHSKILLMKTLGSERYAEGILEKGDISGQNDGVKGQRLAANRKSFDEKPKTFREKSMEWYLGFIESKRQKALDNKQKSHPSKKPAGSKDREKYFLPPIATHSEINGGKFSGKPLFYAVGHINPEEELQKLRQQRRELQLRVWNFINCL